MTPTPEAVALLAEAIRAWQDPEGREVHDRDCGCGIEAQGMLLAYPPLAAALDVGIAWQDAMDALPEYARGPALYPVWSAGRTSWSAEAYGPDTWYVRAPTPVDALRALTAKLLEAKP